MDTIKEYSPEEFQAKEYINKEIKREAIKVV